MVDVHLNFQILILEGGLLSILIDCVFLSPFIVVQTCHVSSSFSRTARLCNSVPIECFPLTYDLNGFKDTLKAFDNFKNKQKSV